MKSSIKNFAHSLEDSDLEKLFSLYSVADFETRVNDYELNKDDGDPSVPVHYFRLSQIMRDMLFTCSSIDFGYEMRKQSGASQLNPGIRLYALNQSMLTPMWKGAGMPYVGVSHGSDTNYIFNGLFPEGTVPESDEALSRSMSEAFIRFAATGDSNTPQSSGEIEWPEAFTTLAGERGSLDLQSLSVQIVGGPLGTGAGFASREHAGLNNSTIQADIDEGNGAQQVLNGYGIGAMASPSTRRRSEVLAEEKLLERCLFVNSLAEKLGV